MSEASPPADSPPPQTADAGDEPGGAHIVIEGPYGKARIYSADPDKVGIGSINIGSGSGVTVTTQGQAEVGELNVGLDAILLRELGKAMGTGPGAAALALVAAFALLLALLAWCIRRMLGGTRRPNP